MTGPKNISKKFGIFENFNKFTYMSYSQSIQEIRDRVHKEIVQESTSGTFLRREKGENQIVLKNPVSIINGSKSNSGVIVGFVCCNTGRLMSSDGCTEVRYLDVPVDDLVVLHTEIVQKKRYTFRKTKYHGVF
jgi:hypothetical protein